MAAVAELAVEEEEEAEEGFLMAARAAAPAAMAAAWLFVGASTEALGFEVARGATMGGAIPLLIEDAAPEAEAVAVEMVALMIV